MNKTLLFFIFIIVIVSAIMIALYFLYEKPKQQNINYEQVKLNIFTYDFYNKSQISTNFLIYKNNELFYNSTSVQGGGSFINVSVNNTYTIKTFNKEDQNYYTAYKDLSYFGSGFDPQRIELYLEQPGNLSAKIIQDNYFIIDNLTLSTSDRDIKNISICIKWSINIISVTAEGYNFTLRQIEKFSKYKNYDKCFYVGTLTKNNPTIITLTPTAYIDKTPQDYINIVIIDQDCYRNECKIEENGIDLGMKDVTVQSNLFNFTES